MSDYILSQHKKEQGQKVITIVTKIQNKLFKYQLNDMKDLFSEFVEKMNYYLNYIEEEEKIYSFREALNLAEIAFENRDYLLLADILEYEILRLVKLN
ncbi:MAG: hypothetical protein ACOCZM_00995 [Bacillota bacterium]